jgi:hypothetical protein
MNGIFVIAALYLAKVVLVSALLFGYYRLFLRDRQFHQYNRYYLLGATLASLILPLIRVPVPDALPFIGQAPVLGPALHAIVPGYWNEPPTAAAPAMVTSSRWSADWLLTGIYGGAILLLLGAYLRQLWHIRHDARTRDALFFSQPAFLE